MLTVLAVAGCAGDSGSPSASPTPASSGVRGFAVVDAGCPVLEHASACPQMPLRARIVATRAGTTERVATVETDFEGAFQIPLPPGTYQVQGENLTGAAHPTALPVSVTVREREFAQVKVVFDSGVRGPGG